MTRSNGAEGLTDMGRFLRALYPIVDATSLVEVRAYFKGGQMKREFYDDLKVLEHDALIVADVADVYVGIATRRSSANGKKNNLAWINVFFAELDAGGDKPYTDVTEILDALDSFKPATSMRVMSGGGVHAYWQLDLPLPLKTPEQIAEFETVTRGLQRNLKADKGTWDASRILRLPDTLWHKKTPPRKVKLVL